MSELLEKKLELLSKPVWTYKEIIEFDGNISSPATALKVKNKALNKYDGYVSYGTKYVKTDSVLALYGTSREQEIKKLKELYEELQKGNL